MHITAAVYNDDYDGDDDYDDYDDDDDDDLAGSSWIGSSQFAQNSLGWVECGQFFTGPPLFCCRTTG